MKTAPQHYFENHLDFRAWLLENHEQKEGVNIIFYKIGHDMPSMVWGEAVKVALCFGWIDSTVRSLGDGKRAQYFCRRKPKSGWSKVNKRLVKDLKKENLMHESGLNSIKVAKENEAWTFLDDVENGIVPEELQQAFEKNKMASENFNGFTFGQRKSYLYWLKQAKREETRNKRVEEIVRLCEAGVKSRE